MSARAILLLNHALDLIEGHLLYVDEQLENADLENSSVERTAIQAQLSNMRTLVAVVNANRLSESADIAGAITKLPTKISFASRKIEFGGENQAKTLDDFGKEVTKEREDIEAMLSPEIQQKLKDKRGST